MNNLNTHCGRCEAEAAELTVKELGSDEVRIELAGNDESKEDNCHITDHSIQAKQILPTIYIAAKQIRTQACNKQDNHINKDNGNEDLDQILHIQIVRDIFAALHITANRCILAHDFFNGGSLLTLSVLASCVRIIAAAHLGNGCTHCIGGNRTTLIEILGVLFCERECIRHHSSMPSLVGLSF